MAVDGARGARAAALDDLCAAAGAPPPPPPEEEVHARAGDAADFGDDDTRLNLLFTQIFRVDDAARVFFLLVSYGR